LAGRIRPGSNGSFVTCIRRENVTGFTVRVDGATDVGVNPTGPTTALPPVNLGDGTESGKFQGNAPISAANAFYFHGLVTAP
jgi:hypothetical protein